MQGLLSEAVQRANNQAGIWRRCLGLDPRMPNPIGREWKIEKDGTNEQLVVHWMDGYQAILDLLACSCLRNCELPKCECMVNGLECTDMCRLPDCDNQAASILADKESIDVRGAVLKDEIEDELKDDDDYEY